MTSLSRQLDSLRTAVSSQLGLDRPRVSLLFDKEEGGKLYVDDVLKIGQAGLAYIRKMDSDFASNENDLFDDSAVNIQRAVLTAEENKELDEKIERVIVQLSPYLHHFAAKQLLEWLLYRFYINVYNAKTICISYLPYHGTNTFGRLLSIIDLKDKVFGWLKDYGKQELPVPFHKIVSQCVSRKYSPLTSLQDHIERIIELFGKEYVERKFQFVFTFYASLCVHIITSNTASDLLLSKLLPFIAKGLVSRIRSLRLCCLMIISQLAVVVTLRADKVDSLLKLILFKADKTTVKESLETCVVLCQRQEVNSLSISLKAAYKFAKKNVTLKVAENMNSLSLLTDLCSTIGVLTRSFIPLLVNTVKPEKCLQIGLFLVDIMALDVIDESLAGDMLMCIFKLFSEVDDPEKIPLFFRQHIRALSLRFTRSFGKTRAEWEVRKSGVCELVMKCCGIEAYEVGALVVESPPKKRRRRRSSTRRSMSEDKQSATVVKTKQKPPAENKIEQLAALREPQKVLFKGDPIEKLKDTIKREQWDKAVAGFEKLTSVDYLKNHLASDFENFITEMIVCGVNEGAKLKQTIRQALSKLPITASLAVSLLSFDKKDDNINEKCTTFALEILANNANVELSPALFQQLFEYLRLMTADVERKVANEYRQILAINVLIHLLKNRRGYKVRMDELRLDTIIAIVRCTGSHQMLRGCLQLLTAAAEIAPQKVTSYLMSVFTFMGSGLLKKDNDLTLSIIEQSLRTLFGIIFKEKGNALFTNLINALRLFAVSLIDIPAHRCVRIMQVLASLTPSKYAWIIVAVWFEHYCATWRKNNPKGTLIIYEDALFTFASWYECDEQMSCSLDLINYVIKLGGDFDEPNDQSQDHITEIFNRSKYTVQKLRHFRFVVLEWIARLFASESLLLKMSNMDVNVLRNRLITIAKSMLLCSLELEEFVESQVKCTQKRNVNNPETDDKEQVHSARYWDAITARVAFIIEKFQNVLPASICGRLVVDVLSETAIEPKRKNRALNFLNARLMAGELIPSSCDESVTVMKKLVSLLNSWLKTAETIGNAVSQQKAVLALELIARSTPAELGVVLFVDTVELCHELLNGWSTLDVALVGNLLLLASELLKYKLITKVVKYSNSLCQQCTDMISRGLETQQICSSETESSSHDKLGALLRTKSRTTQSTIGPSASNDALIVCLLTCLQRLLENYGEFLSQHFKSVFVSIARLCCVYDYKPSTQPEKQGDTVQQRLENVCNALAKLELRTMLQPMLKATETLISEPKAVAVLTTISSLFNGVKERATLLKLIRPLCDIYLAAFNLRTENQSLETVTDIDASEGVVIESLLRVVDNLTENELRSFLRRVFDWYKVSLEETDGRKERFRSVVTYRFLNELYEVYKDLVVFQFGQFFNKIPDVLSRCNMYHCEVTARLFDGASSALEAKTAEMLLGLAMKFVANCARQPAFFTLERAKFVLNPLINELDNTDSVGHETRCVTQLADCLFYIADTQNDLLMDIIQKIMLKTRNCTSTVRYRTLLVLEKLFERMGEAVAPVLPTVLPFLIEMLEDDDRKVELQCDKVINVLKVSVGETNDSR